MVWVLNSKYTAKKAMGLKEEEGNAREQQMNRSLPSLNIPSLCTTIFSVGSTTLAHFLRGSHWANPNLAVTGRELQPKFFQLLFQTPQHLDKPKLFKLSKIIRNHSKSFEIIRNHSKSFMIHDSWHEILDINIAWAMGSESLCLMSILSYLRSSSNFSVLSHKWKKKFPALGKCRAAEKGNCRISSFNRCTWLHYKLKHHDICDIWKHHRHHRHHGAQLSVAVAWSFPLLDNTETSEVSSGTWRHTAWSSRRLQNGHACDMHVTCMTFFSLSHLDLIYYD